MGWYDRDRVFECFEGLRAAGYSVTIEVHSRSYTSAHRNGIGRDWYDLRIDGLWRFSSDSPDFHRLMEVCEILNIKWTIENKHVSLEPFQEEWSPLRHLEKEAQKYANGFCAECEGTQYKLTLSSLCDTCLQEKEYQDWKQKRLA